MKLTTEQLAELSRLLEVGMDLPRDQHQAWVEGLTGVDPTIKAALLQMLERGSDFDEAGDDDEFLRTLPKFTRSASGADTTASGFSAPGYRLGPYRLIRELGRGGMGSVWLAERVDGELTRQVAIKFPHAIHGQQFLERFRRERDILAALTHPNIAQVYDAGATQGDGKQYLVMEYVDGVPIDEFCQGIGIREQLQLFLPVCDAVSYAHEHLVIHRDLKPSNILVDRSGRAKLLDFGIAKLLDDSADATRTSEHMLTPAYASPEQIQGGVQTTKADVYSLGAVLYKMLTGRSPHQSDTGNSQAMEIATGRAAVPEASRLNPGLPRDLDFVLGKALRREPEERYASPEALASDVRAFLDAKPVEARSGDAWYRARKLMRLYWVPAAAPAAILMVLAGAFISVVNSAGRAEAARAVAEKRRVEAEAARVEVEAERNQARMARQQSETLRGLAESRAVELDRERRLAEASLESERRFYELMTHLLDDRFLAGNKDSIRLLNSWVDAQQARLKEDPTNADTGRLLGFLHFRRCVAYLQSSAKLAEADCSTAGGELEPFLARDFPDDLVLRSLTSAYTVLGQIYAAAGRKQEAIDVTQKAVGLAGRHSIRDSMRFRAEFSTRSALANVYLLAGRFDEAVRAQEEAFSIWNRRSAKANVPSEQALMLPATMQRYARMLAQKEPRKAEAQMRQALAMLKDLADASGEACIELNEYADALNASPIASLRDPAVAQSYAQRAIAACPPERKPLAMDTLAWSYFRKGEILKAVDVQKEALRLLPPGPSAQRMTLQMSLSQFEKAAK